MYGRIQCFYFHTRVGHSGKLQLTERVAQETHLIGLNGPLNPFQVVAHFGGYTRLPFLTTVSAPGDNPLEFSIADHGATRIILNKKKKTISVLVDTQTNE